MEDLKASMEPSFMFYDIVLDVTVSIFLPLCGGLKKVVPKGSGTIRKCGFAGVGVTLLEEVCCCGGRL